MTINYEVPEISVESRDVYVTSEGKEYPTKAAAVEANVIESTGEEAKKVAEYMYPSSKTRSMIVKAITNWELHKRGLLLPLPEAEGE